MKICYYSQVSQTVILDLLDNPENKTQIAKEILDLREKRTQLQMKESSDRENGNL